MTGEGMGNKGKESYPVRRLPTGFKWRGSKRGLASKEKKGYPVHSRAPPVSKTITIIIVVIIFTSIQITNTHTQQLLLDSKTPQPPHNDRYYISTVTSLFLFIFSIIT